MPRKEKLADSQLSETLIKLQEECAKAAYLEWTRTPPFDRPPWENLPNEDKETWRRIAVFVLLTRENFWKQRLG